MFGLEATGGVGVAVEAGPAARLSTIARGVLTDAEQAELVRSFEAALATGEWSVADVALVDVHLVDGPTGVEVGRTLSADPRTTVVFMTANAKRVPDDYAGAFGIIAKPYTERVVASVLHYLCERRAGRTGDRPGPELSLDGFNLAPRARA